MKVPYPIAALGAVCTGCVIGGSFVVLVVTVVPKAISNAAHVVVQFQEK